MALTDVSLIDFSAIPALDPLAPIGPAWLLLVQDNVSGAVWRASTVQAKAIIAPALVVTAASSPVVALVLSANVGQLGTLITLSATATSATSTIARVDFYDSGAKVGTASTQPYQTTYTPAMSGRHSIVAVATDANGTATTSAAQNLDISALVVAPIVVVLAPMAPGSVGTALSLTASATLVGGTIAKVEFFDGTSKIGEAASSPYGCSYVPTTAGPHYFTAKASSITGASAMSPALTVQVVQPVTMTNQPPACSLSTSNTTLIVGQSATLSALATDADGSVAKVEFFDGASLLSVQQTPPFSFSYIATAPGGHAITVKATDNLGAVSTAQVNITVNALAIAALAPTNVTAALVAPSAFIPSYSVGVTWLAPAANGSLPISGYYIYRDGGPVPIGSSALLNFTDSYVRASEVHSYTVAAFTGPGVLVGALSIATTNLTVPAAAVNTVPGAPTMGTPIANATSISVYFTPSANTGGSVVNYYDIYRNNQKIGSTPSTYYPDSATLVVGMQYVYTVIAVNTVGPSAFSNPSVGVYLLAAAVTPPSVAPGAPTGTTATLGAASATPTITIYAVAPTNNGGAAITGYVIYRNGAVLPGATNVALPYADTTATNGGTYAYTVAATNSAGTGPQSTGIAPVYPVAPAVVYNTTLTGPATTIASGQPGAGITLTSPGGADMLKFNSITGGSSLAQRMNVFVAGTQVAGVDFPTSYAGAGFSYTSVATGITRNGIFANGSVTIQ